MVVKNHILSFYVKGDYNLGFLLYMTSVLQVFYKYFYQKKEHVEIVYCTTFSVCILSLSKNLLAMVVRYYHSGLFGYSCYFGGFNIIYTMHARGYIISEKKVLCVRKLVSK